MNLFFWLLLNLGVPIVGPICTLALVAPAHGSRVAAVLMCASVREGQLFWCAIGLCAAAAYEAMSALLRGTADPSLVIGLTAGLCFVSCVCSGLVMLGSVNAYHRRIATADSQGVGRSATRGFSRVEIGLSVSLTIVAALLSATLHIFVN